MQGRIADFSIPEIFQLVASQQKSGGLSIKTPDRETVFLFNEGNIVDVLPEKREPDALLGTMLVDAGYLTEESLRRHLQEQGKSGKKLGELLVEKGVVTTTELGRYLSLQVRESLYEVLKLKDGSYRFEPFSVRTPAGLGGEAQRPDVLLMDGMQFLDEYPLFRKKFPAGDFRVTVRKGAGGADLSGDEKELFQVLGYSDVPRRIFRKAFLGWFEGIKALHGLLQKGLIEVREEVRQAVDPRSLMREQATLRENVARLRGVIWGVAAVAACLWLYAIFLSPRVLQAFSGWAGFF